MSRALAVFAMDFEGTVTFRLPLNVVSTIGECPLMPRASRSSPFRHGASRSDDPASRCDQELHGASRSSDPASRCDQDQGASSFLRHSDPPMNAVPEHCFELSTGLCGTYGCGKPFGHFGLCTSEVLGNRKRPASYAGLE